MKNLKSKISIVVFKYLLVFFLIVFSIGLFAYCIFLYNSQYVFIESVKSKKYLLTKTCLMLRPNLVNYKINEDYFGFDYAMSKNDVILMEVLDPYTKVIDVSFNESSVFLFCVNQNNVVALEYVLKKDLLRKKGESKLTMSYQRYLDLTLLISRQASNNDCGALLINYGANPFYDLGLKNESENNHLLLPCIFRYPEYLSYCYKKEGQMALIKMKRLLVNNAFNVHVLANYFRRETILSAIENLKNDNNPNEDNEIVNEMIQLLIKEIKE